MDMKKVQSSDLESVGYDPDSLTLVIWFHSGGRYKYLHVPQRVYDQLMSAESLGTFFARFIKNKKEYPCYNLRTGNRC